MNSWLKKHFIPHKDNNFRPHFLHAKNARALLGLVLALELLVFILPTLTFVSRVDHNTNLASVLPGVLAVLTNQEREMNNLPDLVVSPLLTQAAEMKAQDMATKGYFAHTSPEGKTPWYWLEQVGYRYDYAGENLAINFNDSKDVTDAWMNSPTHRANIVKSAYKEVGTGIAVGMYEGRTTVFVAQVYANPRNDIVDRALAQAQIPAAKNQNIVTKTAVKNSDKNTTKAGTLAIAETKKPTTGSTVAGNSNASEVLGESTAQNPVKSEPVVGTTSVRSKDLGVGGNSDLGNSLENSFRTPTSFETLASSPRHALSVTLFTILGIIMVALVLNIVIKSNIQHPDLITNGLFVAVVIVTILTANSFIGTKNLAISSGFDYSKTQTANVVEVLN